METPMYKVCYMLENFMVYKFFKTIDDVADFIRGKAYSVVEIKRVDEQHSNISSYDN